MPTGTIKFFNNERGFGFITTDEDPDLDIYVNIVDVIPAHRSPGLNGTERVEFDIIVAPKGPQATNVKRLFGAE
jgi:CspA family cold shock protein